MLLLPSSTIEESTSNLPFILPTNASPPTSFAIGHIITFGYPYYSQIPKWRIGKIIAVHESTLDVLVSSPTEKKKFYFIVSFKEKQFPFQNIRWLLLLH